LLRLTLLLRGPKHSTSEQKQENRNCSDGLPEPKEKSHDTSLVGVAARRMMSKIASSDASIALETIECRSILGATIYWPQALELPSCLLSTSQEAAFSSISAGSPSGHEIS
jgi:hypothetical protein